MLNQRGVTGSLIGNGRIDQTMKRQSERMKERMKIYHAQIEEDAMIQKCALCGKLSSKILLERHHPYRRLGANLYKYEYVCHEPCHREIEEGKHPDHLPRDGNETEKKFHGLGPEDNMLKQ